VIQETEWDDGFKIVEVIELTGPVGTVVCLIGTWPSTNKVVRFETYRGDELVHEEEFGFGPDLPMAALLSDLEEGLRKDAAVKGARLQIFEVPAPYGPEQFEEMLSVRRAAGGK